MGGRSGEVQLLKRWTRQDASTLTACISGVVRFCWRSPLPTSPHSPLSPASAILVDKCERIKL